MPLCSEKVIIKDILIKVGHFKHLEKKRQIYHQSIIWQWELHRACESSISFVLQNFLHLSNLAKLIVAHVRFHF